MKKDDWILFAVIYIPSAMAISFGLVSCTLSFHNVMTSGVASDVIDETQKADAKVDTQLDIPGVKYGN